MAPPESVPIDPGMATDFHIATETPSVVSYKFWILRAGDKWYPIGPEQTDDARSDHWMFVPPLPAGSQFAYWIGVWGHANAVWRVRINISQRDPNSTSDSWIARGSWTESGVLTDEGNGGGLATLPRVPRVRLGQ